ncbi:hypothetical protein SI65_08448 [Aspergillus cristatus]|uniref:Uncharacterized protein n=1 Tax=Aspergillus cristatus TaxID=573508 RepID=A0A1E3B526_ASPCR|nr:hypothetical protein SI65_08448 [Aspergillus cristatus]
MPTFRSHSRPRRRLSHKETNPPTRAACIEKIKELLKENAAILESIESNCEESIIDWMLIKYDCQKMRQYLKTAMEIYARGDAFGEEDSKRIMSESAFKADILADAELYVAGLRKDRDTFTFIYNQEPERVLEYHKKGFHYVLRLLEYHANLRLTNRTITPEVEKLHIFFIRKLFLSGFLSDKELEPSVREHSYEYWKAVRDTMAWG